MGAIKRVWACVVFVCALATSAFAGATGFEVGEGFIAGTGPWPVGWTAKPAGVRVGSTAVTGGSQSLEVGMNGTGWSAMDYVLPAPITAQPGVVTQISLDIRASGATVPGDWNFVGFGFFIASDIDGYPVGAVSFDLRDTSYSYSTNPPQYFDVQATDPVYWYGWQNTGADFAPGTWYHFTTLIDWSAGTTTNRLSRMDDSVVFQWVASALPNGVASFRFGGVQYTDTQPAYFDNFYVGDQIPEPATLALLGLGGLAALRRRKA